MKLLILTQYFPPEVGAPQNRLYELGVRLRKAGVEVSVLTAMPNYPQMKIYPGYEGKKYVREELGNMIVHRCSIFVSSSRSIVSRLRNYFSFVYFSARASSFLGKEYDFLFCESPPLFLGYSAMYLSRKKKAKLIFNVSDLWPESAEKLGVVTNPVLLKFAYRLEARLYKRSALVTGQTQGICADINKRFPQVKIYWLPNGVDLDYYDPQTISAGSWRQDNGFAGNDFVVLYAGIIGIAQGLEVITDAAAICSENSSVKFVLMGAGPEKENLIQRCRDNKITNVFFLEAVPKSKMPSVLKSVNAAVVPLRKLPLFEGAIPSKIFESLAMEIPVLLGVDGEAKELFVNQGNCALHFEPENPAALANVVERLVSDPELCKSLGVNGRRYVASYFNREVIANEFYNQLRAIDVT